MSELLQRVCPHNPDDQQGATKEAECTELKVICPEVSLLMSLPTLSFVWPEARLPDTSNFIFWVCKMGLLQFLSNEVIVTNKLPPQVLPFALFSSDLCNHWDYLKALHIVGLQTHWCYEHKARELEQWVSVLYSALCVCAFWWPKCANHGAYLGQSWDKVTQKVPKQSKIAMR
jgi:hypothetical protein